jgi:hypothetical protein
MEQDDIDVAIDKINEGKFESEIAGILGNLQQNDDFNQAIEQIFAQTTDLYEIQSMMIIVLKKHLESKLDAQHGTEHNIKIDEKKIAQDIAKFTRKIMEEKFKDTLLRDDFNEKALEGNKLDKTDRYRYLTGKAREDYKRVLKQIAIYEIYKIINPKQLAGETRKQNFVNNMYMGGEKLASKYF